MPDTLPTTAPAIDLREVGTAAPEESITIPAPVRQRPTALRLVAAQARAELRQAWRTPIATFFTLVLPVVFLVLITGITGNAVVDQLGGIRIAQFTTPALMGFAIATATFSYPAIAVVTARESGALKRLRGTPLPPWAYLAGYTVAATLLAFASVAIMLVVAVLAFDVQLSPGAVPAGILTLLVGILSFLALGFAVAGLVRSAGAAQGVGTGIIILLGFVSEVFLIAAETPRWLTAIGDVFPLKHLVNGLRDVFDPYLVGSAWNWTSLTVLAAWGVAGAVVAVWRFGWEPRGVARTAAARSTPIAFDGLALADAPIPAPVLRQVSAFGLVRDQAVYATRSAFRDRASLVFSVLMPVGLLLLLPAVFGSGEMPWRGGMRFPQFYAPAMAVYGIAVHAFVNVPEALAASRDRGVLKRLRGTPLRVRTFLAGRLGSILLVAALITLGTVGAGVLVYDVAVPLSRLPVLVVTLVLGTTSMAALGLMVAGVVPNARSVPAISLGIFLPLSFVSDIFMLGDLPTAVAVIGWLFPLKHFVHAMVNAIDPTAALAGWSFVHLAVLTAWGLVGAAVAARTFRWTPRVAAGGRQEPVPVAAAE